MTAKKRKAINLLNRIQFIDLAQAVTVSRSGRKDWLREYLRRALRSGRFPSYRYFRAAIPTIYGVQRGLDLSPPVARTALEKHIRQACNGIDEAINVDATLTLFDLVRPVGYAAYDHLPKNLPLGLSRTAAIGLEVYLVDDQQVVFQFPYPRRGRLEDRTIEILLSIIHHAYAVDDFEAAAVELADLSCDGLWSPSRKDGVAEVRSPRIVRLPDSSLISMDDLGPEIQSVHDILLEIGDEPDAP